MEIKVDTEMVAKAIFDGFSEEQRMALVEGAIQNLLIETEPDPRNTYGRPKKKIQLIFETAVYRAAMEIIEEEVKKPEVKAKFAQFATDVFEKAFGMDRHDTPEYMTAVDAAASAFLKALTKNV